jgi:hypothetical protein
MRGLNDMNVDDSDSETIVTGNDRDGGGNTGPRTAGSGIKRSNPDCAYTPDPDAEKEDVDKNQRHTRVRRGKARSVSSPMNTRVSKKVTQTRAFTRTLELERRNAVEAFQMEQLVALLPG